MSNPAVSQSQPLRAAIAAEFKLQVDSPGQPDVKSAGVVVLLADGRVCVRTQTPLRQEIWMAGDGTAVYYPDRAIRLRIAAQPNQLPPTLDALVAASADPAAALPRGSVLVGQTRDGKTNTATWRVVTPAGASSLRVREQFDGVSELVLRDEKGLMIKHYIFAGRPSRGPGLPATIVAEHFGGDATLTRRERWQLRPMAVATQGRAGCAEPPPGTAVRDVKL